MNRESKLKAANAALADFAPDTKIEMEGNRIKIAHPSFPKAKPWRVQAGQDFYPSWYKSWPHGGTACKALSQLVRWLQDKPVLPLSTWRYWSGESIKLGSEETVQVLKLAGYPAAATCIKCGQLINGQFDWFRVGQKTGPGHVHKCRPTEVERSGE